MEQKEARMQELYDVAEKTAQSPQPKRSLFGSKCPKCGGKLQKESVKGMLFAGEGCSEFAKKVVAKSELPPGVYNLSVNRYTCKPCGYDYAKSDVSEVSED